LVRFYEEGVLVEEWTMHGTHSGFLDSLPPTGNRIALDGVSVVTISDDGITSIEGYFDQESFAEQLGLTFPAIIGQLPTLAVEAVKEAL
jgi:predicted ester cyclase